LNCFSYRRFENRCNFLQVHVIFHDFILQNNIARCSTARSSTTSDCTAAVENRGNLRYLSPADVIIPQDRRGGKEADVRYNLGNSGHCRIFFSRRLPTSIQSLN